MERRAEQSSDAAQLAALKSPGCYSQPTSGTTVTPNSDDDDSDPLPSDDRSSTDNFILDPKNPRLYLEKSDCNTSKFPPGSIFNQVVDVEKNVDEKSTGYKVTKHKSKKSATAAATSSCSVSFDKKFVPLTPTQLSKKREKARKRFIRNKLEPRLRAIENEVDPVERMEKIHELYTFIAANKNNPELWGPTSSSVEKVFPKFHKRLEDLRCSTKKILSNKSVPTTASMMNYFPQQYQPPPQMLYPQQQQPVRFSLSFFARNTKSDRCHAFFLIY